MNVEIEYLNKKILTWDNNWWCNSLYLYGNGTTWDTPMTLDRAEIDNNGVLLLYFNKGTHLLSLSNPEGILYYDDGFHIVKASKLLWQYDIEYNHEYLKLYCFKRYERQDNGIRLTEGNIETSFARCRLINGVKYAVQYSTKAL